MGWGSGRDVLKGAGFELAWEKEVWKGVSCMVGEEGLGWKGLGRMLMIRWGCAVRWPQVF